jgi:hypothetical protein
MHKRDVFIVASSNFGGTRGDAAGLRRWTRVEGFSDARFLSAPAASPGCVGAWVFTFIDGRLNMRLHNN